MALYDKLHSEEFITINPIIGVKPLIEEFFVTQCMGQISGKMQSKG